MLMLLSIRMSRDDFEKLKNNVGGLLSFTSFISTSMDKEVSIAFIEGAQSHADTTGVLFLIDINPSIKSYPFAFVAGRSFFECEDEVLFSMNTTFRICSIGMADNGLWHVNLQLARDYDSQLRELLRYLRNDLQGFSALSRLADLLRQMSAPEKSQEICELLIERSSGSDAQELAFLQRQLALAHHRMGNLPAALELYKKSLQLKLTFLPPDHPSLSISYSNIGAIFLQQGHHDDALIHFQRALQINLKQAEPNQASIAHCQNNIGLVLRNQGRYAEALEYLQSALNIDLQRLPPTHPLIVMTYGSISSIYSLQGNYTKADEYSEKCLSMMYKCLPPNHLDFAAAHIWRAEALEGLSSYQDAFQHAQVSVDILIQYKYPVTHCDRQNADKVLERTRAKL